MSSFNDRLKKVQSESGSISVDWSGFQQNFSDLGDARQAPLSRQLDDANVIDKALPTIRGRIVDVQAGKIGGRMDLVVAVTTVSTPPGSECHIKVLESGACVQLGVSKWKNPVKEMIATPHVFCAPFFAVELDGILAISVPTKNAKVGAGKVDVLEFHHIQIGAMVEIPNVSVVYRTSEKTSNGYVAASGGTPSVEAVASQPFVADRISTLFKTISSECPGFQRQLCRSLARLTNCPCPALVESARKDAAELEAHIRALVVSHANHKVVIDSARSVDVLSEDAKASMLLAADALSDFSKADRPVNTLAPGNEVDFHHLFPFDGRRAHIVPLIQNSMSPSINAEYVKREISGFGVAAFGIRYLADENDKSDPANKLNFAAEAVLSASVEKLSRTDADKRNKSIGAFSIDARALNLCMKQGKTWEFHIPTLDTGVAISAKQCLFSATKAARCDIKNVIGFYDFFKMQMIFHTIIPYCNFAFFTADYEPVATSHGFGLEASSMQPALGSDFGGTRPGENIHNIVDMTTAIASVGIRIPKTFVSENVLYEDGTVVTADPFQQYGELMKDGKTMSPPVPPKLETHGYCPINSISETNFQAKLRKIPEGTGSVEFYAIYDGCDKVADHASANNDETAGETALRAFLTSGDREKLSVSDAIKQNVAIYAIAVKKVVEKRTRPAATSIPSADGAMSSEEEEFDHKAQKVSDGEIA